MNQLLSSYSIPDLVGVFIHYFAVLSILSKGWSLRTDTKLAICKLLELDLESQLKPDEQKDIQEYIIGNKKHFRDWEFLRMAGLMPDGTRFNENKHDRDGYITKWILDNVSQIQKPTLTDIFKKLKKGIYRRRN